MTTFEFSDGFDTMLNSYARKAAFGDEISRETIALDEYEKSVFLTKAQEELVLSLYTGKNPYGESFESTEELRRYLAPLIKEKGLKPIANTRGFPIGLESKSKFFTLPEDLWFITYEEVLIKGKCKCGSSMKVYPVKQDEYQCIKDNPFRGANDMRALRLDLSEGNVEIICKYLVSDYYIRYLKKLSPIVLENLPDGLTINSESHRTGCTLHESLHQRILDRAVMLALQSKGYNFNKETRDN